MVAMSLPESFPGINASSVSPTASAAGQRNTCSAAWLKRRIRCNSSTVTIASIAESMMPLSRSRSDCASAAVCSRSNDCSASCFSVTRRLVMSRNTSTVPWIFPSPSRIGAALSSIGASVRLPIRIVIRQPHDLAFSQHPRNGALDGCPGKFIHDPEYVIEGFAASLRFRPSHKRRCNPVREGHLAPGIGSDDRVADAGEGGFETLPLMPLGSSARKARSTAPRCERLSKAIPKPSSTIINMVT